MMLIFTVCPVGFEWFNGQRCVAVIETAASKNAAVAKCKELNPLATLMMPKTMFEQIKLEQFVVEKSIAGTDFYIGMAQTDGYWFWDDGSPVFVRSRFQ